MTELKKFNSIIETDIKKKNPNLKENTITRYRQLLTKLYGNVLNGNETYDIGNFETQKNKFIKYLNNIPATDGRRFLSAIYSILPNDKNYLDLKNEIYTEATKIYESKEKNEKQQEQSITMAEIEEKFKLYEAKAKKIYKKGIMNLTPQDYQDLQSYIILSLNTLINPRRSLDLIEFKIQNINKNKDNYLLNNHIIFNTYKGSDFKKEQIIPIPTKLKNILNQYIGVNPTDHLLFTLKYKPLTVSQLTKKLNSIFDNRKISINEIRHAFFTEKLGNDYYEIDDKITHINNEMKKSGSSIKSIKNYIKY